MPDIGDLLRSAAPGPSAEPDLVRVQRRARVLRRRQQLVVTSPLVVGAVVLLVWSNAAGRPDALQQLPVDRAATEPTADPSAAPRVPAPTPRPGAAAGAGASPAARSDDAVVPGVAPPPARPQPQGPPQQVEDAPPRGESSPALAGDSADHPAAPSCSVSSTDLLPGQSRTCRFTATGSGGYVVEVGFGVFASYEKAGAADVFVERSGVVTRYDVYRSDTGCADSVIRPGDRVTVTVRQSDSESEYEDFTLRAGTGYGCRGS